MFDKVNEVLPLVTKPIRYTGGEYNTLLKATEPSKVSWVLAMPEVYELGMSNYGLRILYSVINRIDNAACDRVYCPWPDFGALLRKEEMPLYALESKRPVKEFDILGVSLQTELSYTNLLYLLDLAQIPLHRDERDTRHPLVVAGGPCTVNPLPLVDFIDAFVVGDGEEPVREITEVYADWNHRNRDDLLSSIARLSGLFVPGKTERRRNSVRRRILEELKEEDFPFPPVVPICETVHNRLTIEINRGCTRGCRFCQAGMINRPVRFRTVEQIVSLAEQGIRATGWEEISLLSLSTLDYPDLLNLVHRLNSRLKGRNVALSLPSTRGEEFSPELAFDMKEVKKTGLTFAPETVSSHLKSFINKNISEARTVEAIRTALDAGWRGVKLYFMLGLPTETDADVDEIGRFVNEIARMCQGRAVRYKLSPFVPKPHTPLQWAGFVGVEQVREKIDRLKSVLTRRNIKAKWEKPESSFVQALLARGDERLGRVIEDVYHKGGVFQEWTEYFRFPNWVEACEKEGVDPDEFTGRKELDFSLPWDFIDTGVDKAFLRREYERAQQGEETPDCGRTGCTGCGICPEGKPPPRPEKTAVVLTAYGRKSKPVMNYNEPKNRFRLRYVVKEPYRFAAHLDRVRALYHSLRRSELPIIYTRGFSPKPMLSLGPPLPVGLVSEGEYVDIFTSFRYSGNVVRDFGPFLPRGLQITAGRRVPLDWPSLCKLINLGRYLIRVPDVGERLPELVEHGHRLAGVRNLAQGPQAGLILDLAIVPGVRLFSTLAQLFGIEEKEVRCLRVARLDCLIERDSKIMAPMEGVNES